MTDNQTTPKILTPGIHARPDVGIIRPNKKIDLEGAVALEFFFQVRNKDGKITHERLEQGHSFVANFIKLLYCTAMIHHAPYVDGLALTLFDTGGTERSGHTSYAIQALGSGMFAANASSGNDYSGIQVGTDDGTILTKDINNYQLGAKIAHGTGAGQLSYGDHSIVPVTHDGASYSYAGITRSFSNGSGAGIDVKEIGLVTYMYWDYSTTRFFLLSRDILGTPVTVPDGQALTASIRCKCYC
jgi:hypothetical protein